MQKRNIGIVLVILGILMVSYTGFNYVTKKNVVDIGPIQIDKKENHPVSWSPILGAILLVGGVVIIVTGKNK
ncbi:MAG: hypothetical protein NTV09_06075 [Bacteroidetes bacterium]|nr:hypothetical protein [Bacteroidota bacterium]